MANKKVTSKRAASTQAEPKTKSSAPEMTGQQAVTRVKEYLSIIEREVGLPHVVTQLQRHDLLRGLTYEPVFRKISERLDENIVEKTNMAEYLSRRVITEGTKGGGKRIFIESGSTLAVVSAALSPRLHEQADWPPVLTNNFLTLTALEIGRAQVTGGYLRDKYLAFLDFFPAMRPSRRDEGEGVDITDSDKAVDAQSFLRLNTLVCGIDIIYMAASDFGFLIGPLVGDRANAIFKYCLINPPVA